MDKLRHYYNSFILRLIDALVWRKLIRFVNSYELEKNKKYEYGARYKHEFVLDEFNSNKHKIFPNIEIQIFNRIRKLCKIERPLRIMEMLLAPGLASVFTGDMDNYIKEKKDYIISDLFTAFYDEYVKLRYKYIWLIWEEKENTND